MTQFKGVVPVLQKALETQGYDSLTPVQEAVTAPDLQEADLLVSAQTGSGKTVGFGLAMASTLLGQEDCFAKARSPLALVIAPTRELALQVKRELQWLYDGAGAVIASCVGGMDIVRERRALQRGVHIVVGTPGRLCDHVRRGVLNGDDLRVVVLDEADEMLDLGFRDDLEFLLGAAPKERRTLLFSATVPTAIAQLARNFQRDAIRIKTLEEKKQHSDIDYQALVSAPREKENAIVNVLRYYDAENAIIFCNTRAAVNHMLSRLNNRGFSVVALSGELTQNERSHALQAMRDGRARVCIATDVAARGIDLPGLELVIHADLPNQGETLLHRSGRTGRAGRKGISALMVDVKGRKRAERLLAKAKIQAKWDHPPSFEAVLARDEARIIQSPLLIEEMAADEESLTQKILDHYTPQQIAAAFIRGQKQGKSAPEELEKVSLKDSKKARREGKKEFDDGPRGLRGRNEFAKSQWLRLSVGRKHNAEPRWLIPLLCKAGDIQKADIGMIKMQPRETYVQLNGEVADDFLFALGPDGVLEKGVQAKPISKPPQLDDSLPAAKSRGKKNSRPRTEGSRHGKKDGKPRFSASKDGRKKSEKPSRSAKPLKSKALKKKAPSKKKQKD